MNNPLLYIDVDEIEPISIGNLGKAIDGAGKYTTFGSRNSSLLKAIMITSGGISGGISSTIGGGSFWNGMKQSLITSGLNHLAHSALEDYQQDDSSATKDDKERWKSFRKSFNKNVSSGNYCEAAQLAVDVFNLDKNVKDLYDLTITKEDVKSYMTTGGDAFQKQMVEITTKFFQGHLGSFVRSLHHEFVHVFQRGVFGDVSSASSASREWFAYLDSVYNTDLPPASSVDVLYWKENRMVYYWNEMKKIYPVTSK